MSTCNSIHCIALRGNKWAIDVLWRCRSPHIILIRSQEHHMSVVLVISFLLFLFWKRWFHSICPVFLHSWIISNSKYLLLFNLRVVRFNYNWIGLANEFFIWFVLFFGKVLLIVVFFVFIVVISPHVECFLTFIYSVLVSIWLDKLILERSILILHF